VSSNDAGIPQIRDYALLGDCRTTALVSTQCSIDWFCVPRFDGGAAFARLLDAERGGACSLAPATADGFQSSRSYLEDTLVLATSFEAQTGAARVLDALILDEDGPPGPGGPSPGDTGPTLVRIVEGERGTVEFALRIVPRFDYGDVRPWIARHGDRLQTAIGGNDALVIWCDAGLQQTEPHELGSSFSVHPGERVRIVLRYSSPERVPADPPEPSDVDGALERTAAWWRQWCGRIKTGSERLDVHRSALTLKALTYAPTGAIVAAPTTSLPEAIPGERNWDYRFAWVRDASFSSRAFVEVGCSEEADAFRAFIMRSAAGHAEDLQIVYGAGGERRIGTAADTHLSGYGGVGPVRIGNGAAGQLQLDAYGELVNLSWRWHRRGHSPDDDDWRFLVSLIDHASEQCAEPDHGIWEWPGEPDHFVHSKVMCWAALDRGIRLADECLRRAPTRRWRATRDELREQIDSHGYDADRGIYVQAYDRPELDAALLLLPTVEYLEWSDERMLRTVAAVREELAADEEGLLYRYRRDDGLDGDEGAFISCSFWLAEALARGGELEQAQRVFERAVATANDVGLFAEEIDPHSGELRGNFPQGLSHLSHISAAAALAAQRETVAG
jgi:GH15 family glucan-1,4-alpha-glucosidase